MLPYENRKEFPERAAHCRRVEYLCSLVAAKLGVAERRDKRLAAKTLEACDEFDGAIEFSVYDGTTMADAIAEFFEESERHDRRIMSALRTLACSKPRLNFQGKLPVMPKAVARLMRTSPENTTVRELESIACSDPVLTARLLEGANSASLGSRHTVMRIDQAILRVGVPFARTTLMTAALGPLFASATLKKLWAHSQEVAATARELAACAGFDQEIAYVAGLLHDVGRLIVQRCPAELHAEEDHYLAAGFPRVYAEQMVYGMDHATVGLNLLRQWSIPEPIVDAVGQHHSPEANKSVLASILYLAETQEGDASGVPETLSMNMRRVVACRNAGLPLYGVRGLALSA